MPTQGYIHNGAVLAGAYLRAEPDAGRILMRGRDRAALLHRLTTNDIERLRPGQGLASVLTSPIGRIIDVLFVYALDDMLLIVTSQGQGPAVFSHLRKNIFFNDQVTLEAAGRSYAQYALYGSQAATLLEQLSGCALHDLQLHHTRTFPIADGMVILARRPDMGGLSYTLYVPVAQAEALEGMLATAGFAPLDDTSYELARIEQGLPIYGHELSLDYIPLETGLWDAISFTKGCYVGQEIIARMESRNRLAKQLRGLRLSAMVNAPATLYAEQQHATQATAKDAGMITSAVLSPHYGPIALAYVRSAHVACGTQLFVAGSDVVAEVVDLPFGMAVAESR